MPQQKYRVSSARQAEVEVYLGQGSRSIKPCSNDMAKWNLEPVIGGAGSRHFLLTTLSNGTRTAP